MVTNAEQPEAEPTRAERAEASVRMAVAGHPQGAVRRIILYVATFALIASPFPYTAVVPLGLLAMTDMLA